MQVIELVGVSNHATWAINDTLYLLVINTAAVLLLLNILISSSTRSSTVGAMLFACAGALLVFLSAGHPFRSYQFLATPNLDTSWVARGAFLITIFLLANAANIFLKLKGKTSFLVKGFCIFAGAAILFYTSSELAEAKGRIVWMQLFLPPFLICAACSVACGVSLLGNSATGEQDKLMAFLAVVSALITVVLTYMISLPKGMTESIWWQMPAYIAAAGGVLACVGLFSSYIITGIGSILAGTILYLKLINMGQAVPNNAYTFFAKEAFFSCFSIYSIVGILAFFLFFILAVKIAGSFFQTRSGITG